MILDISIGIPLILFTLLGLRDGVVRKIVAIIVFIASLFFGQSNMRTIGALLVDNGWINAQNASMYGFLIIFISMAIAQGLLYKLLAGSYKLGGTADRLGGLFFGFLEGALFLSSLLYIFALSGIPSREATYESSLYKPIVNIAPQILDFGSATAPEAVEHLKDISKPSEVSTEKSILPSKHIVDSTAAAETKRQNEIINQARSSIRKLK